MSAHRYSGVAIALHWLIALGIFVMIPLGLWMSDAISDPGRQALAYQAFQLHKAIGFTILALTLVRIVWRLLNPPPPPLPSLHSWELFLSRATHAGFYAGLLLLPLTGWVYVSTGWAVATDSSLQVATSWFGLFEIPHLGFVEAASVQGRRELAFSSAGAHEALAFGAIALIVLHVAGALKHQFVDRDATMSAMVPWLRSRSAGALRGRPKGGAIASACGIGFVAVLLGLSALMSEAPAQDAGNTTESEVIAGEGGAAPVIDEVVEPGTSAQWQVADSAEIGFSGEHAGKAFEGGFADWDAHVWFAPDDLAGSKIAIIVQTASAFTGDATQERTLRQREWFNVADFPLARFDSEEFEALGDDRYQIEGTFRLKELQVPLAFEATIAINGDIASASGSFDLQREALDLGMASDPKATWVSAVIPVTFELQARRAPAGP